MAFTGAAVFQKLADNLVRVTGLSLAAAAAGTISLFEGAGEVKLPDNFNISPYSDVDLAEAVEVSLTPTTSVVNGQKVRVNKTLPAGALLVTLTNDDAANASPGLEIYLRFH